MIVNPVIANMLNYFVLRVVKIRSDEKIFNFFLQQPLTFYGNSAIVRTWKVSKHNNGIEYSGKEMQNVRCRKMP